MKAIRRRRFLVNRDFQFRYIGLVAIPLVLFLVSLYYLIYYAVFDQILIPEALATTLLPAMKKVNFTLLIAAPVCLFVIVRMALVYSNRFIGPIPRLERELNKVIAGDRTVRLKTRDGDELNSFISKVNVLLEQINNVK